MTKLEKIVYDAVPFDGSFSEIVKTETAKAIAAAVLPLIEDAMRLAVNTYHESESETDYWTRVTKWLSENITKETE